MFTTLLLGTLSRNILFEGGQLTPSWRYRASQCRNRIGVENKLGSSHELWESWHQQRWMSLMGSSNGATWESDSAGPDGIYSRIHLFRSTNIWNSRDSDKDLWYLISLKIRSCKHTVFPPPKSLGKAEWGSEVAKPWAEPRFHGTTETEEVCPWLWVELCPPYQKTKICWSPKP